MFKRAKFILFGSAVGLAVVAGTGVALAYNGPYGFTAIVPSTGPWYSQPEVSSGFNHESYISSIGGSYSGDMNGEITVGTSQASSSQTLYNNSYQYYTADGTAAGTEINLKIFGDWWVPVDVQVNGQWWS